VPILPEMTVAPCITPKANRNRDPSGSFFQLFHLSRLIAAKKNEKKRALAVHSLAQNLKKLRLQDGSVGCKRAQSS
jgi:hypothetical protein